MLDITITPSTNKGKRYRAEIIRPGQMKNTTVHFGAASGQTFIDHGDKEKKRNYIARHSKLNESWNDITTAGALSRWLLWEKPSLDAAIKAAESKFKVRITNETKD